MPSKIQDPFFPIEWSSWDHSFLLSIVLYDVKFLEDFGAFCKNEEYEAIYVDFENGKLILHNSEGGVIKETKYKPVPVKLPQ